MRYDTVIIGAGLSGIAAGIRLAYFDRSVCILERHWTIGGLNSFYRLRGRDYDVGLHAVTNYAEPGTRTGPLAKLLKQLRLRWDDFRLCPQIESAIAFPQHRLRFNNDFDFFRSQIEQTFPSQRENFARLLVRIDESNELDLNQQAVSARSVLDAHITEPLLIEMLFCPLMYYGSAIPNDMDWNQFVIMFKSIFYEGFGRPYAGVRLIMKNLIRAFRQHGGTLKLRSGVQRIHVEDGIARGVVLDDGTEIEADRILSSAGSVETMQLCGEHPPQTMPDAGEVTFTEAIFPIDMQPQELGHRETIIFFNDSDRFWYEPPAEPCDVRSGVICSPNNFQYDEPLDEGVVRITALANAEHWMNLAEDEYQSQKELWCRRMIDSAVRFMPDFREHICDMDMFTPRTIKKFTGHIRGCVYGAPQKVLSGETHIPNLFLCGTDQGFLGIIGSMLSGITMANNHCLR